MSDDERSMMFTQLAAAILHGLKAVDDAARNEGLPWDGDGTRRGSDADDPAGADRTDDGAGHRAVDDDGPSAGDGRIGRGV